MSDAPELISLELRQGMANDFWSECRDPRYAKSEPVAYVRADRLEAQEALLREAMEVLLVAADELDWAGREIDEMLCVLSREPRGITGAVADQARATLAKLRQHFEGGGNHP